jgi:hypothetical protein
MKAFEVKKGQAGIEHGRVMMAIEGPEAKITAINEVLRADFRSCDYVEEGEREGEVAYFFMVDRSEKESFMIRWKEAKKAK